MMMMRDGAKSRLKQQEISKYADKENSAGKGLNRKGEYWNDRKDNEYV